MIANILCENTSILSYDDIHILAEQKDISASPTGIPINKIIFKAKLQSAEEDNQNMRYYTRDILQEIVRLLKPKAKARSLFQEVDHPFVNSTDTMIMKKRAITVKLSNCGSLIRDLYMDGNDVIGEIETLSGFKGPDLYNLIYNDQATIGFSVRMFGRLVREGTRNYVKSPIRPITYDVVTNPSHKGSVVLEFLPEDLSSLESVRDTNLFTEDVSCDCLICDNVNIDTNSFTDTIDYLTDLIEETYSSYRLVKFNF